MMADTDTLRQDTARRIGRRISVRGHTGSGKTTVARQLGSALGLPVVELDTLFWRPNWQETPLEEFRAKVVEALAKHDDGWVCAGNYNSAVADLVLPMADTVVWLRPPLSGGVLAALEAHHHQVLDWGDSLGHQPRIVPEVLP